MKRNMVYSYILSVLPSTAIAQKLEEDDADFLRRWGITELWMNDRMSNFDYLICLNQASGRSFQDITQYPVFPWLFNGYCKADFDVKYECWIALSVVM